MEKRSMKVIMVGTLADGFGIHSVVPADQAIDVIAHLTADGKTVDSLDLEDPKSLDKRAKGGSEDGRHYVVYGKGLGNGFNIYGPFVDDNFACDFGEENRGEDDEWEVFEFDGTPGDPLPKTREGDQMDEDVAAFLPGMTIRRAPDTNAITDRFTEILQHKIRFGLRNTDGMSAPEELDETSVEHIAKLIAEGYISGELCVQANDGDTEFRGWWEIDRS